MAYNLGGCRSIQLSYERNPNFVVILEGHVKLGVYDFNGSKHLTSKWALLARAAGKEFMSRWRRKGPDACNCRTPHNWWPALWPTT